MRLPASGQISFAIYLDCPHCGDTLDLIEHPFNEEGDWNVRLADWFSNKPKADKPEHEIDCPTCRNEILVSTLEY